MMQRNEFWTRITNSETGAVTFVFSDSAYARDVAQNAALNVADLLGGYIIVENLEEVTEGPTLDDI